MINLCDRVGLEVISVEMEADEEMMSVNEGYILISCVALL